uniref:Uncharacterized protein n=1 Tax=Tetranychus urticae TaxID=32264 RepID=T1L5I9_TETUR
MSSARVYHGDSSEDNFESFCILPPPPPVTPSEMGSVSIDHYDLGPRRPSSLNGIPKNSDSCHNQVHQQHHSKQKHQSQHRFFTRQAPRLDRKPSIIGN